MHFYPGMLHWWKNTHGGDCGGEARVGCGGGSEQSDDGRGPRWRGGGWGRGGGYEFGHGEGGGFGVRRPLRFLAYKLELDQTQIDELAKILSDLKTERAQGEVDDRRAVGGFADALSGAAFDDARAKTAAEQRAKTAGQLADAVHKALGRIHALLNEEQRGRLAYLIRTGVVSL